MKRFYAIILTVIIFISVSFNGFAFDNTIVDDRANLFSESEVEEISLALQKFTSETSYSSAVVTADYAEGKSSQDFADDYYDNLVVSEGWSQNGILFLVDMDNREVCISTMGACIEVYGYYIDAIIDSGYNELANGFYSECILLMIESAYGYAKESSEIDDNGYYSEDISYFYEEDFFDEDNFASQSSHIDFGDFIICFVISLLIAAICVFCVKSNYKNIGKGDEFDSDDLVLRLTGSNDTVISRNVITTKIPRNNNNNHRPGGGGVSHRSSGGFSHGGGSRKF